MCDRFFREKKKHEYGHILQNTLIRKEFEKAGWGASNASAFVNTSGKTQKAMYKWYYDFKAKVKYDCYNEIIAIAKENNPNFSLMDNISKYGRANKAEFFAEVIVFCPRCGKKLEYFPVGNAAEVKCPSKKCIRGSSKGIYVNLND